VIADEVIMKESELQVSQSSERDIPDNRLFVETVVENWRLEKRVENLQSEFVGKEEGLSSFDAI
jgi:hypothetical protein